MIKSLARRLALSIPPMRRFYNFAMYQSHLGVEQQAHILELNDRLAAAQVEFGSLERARAMAEALDVQLYVLRSDLQRSAARNAELSHELHRLETASAQQGADRTTFDSLTMAIEAVGADVQLGGKAMVEGLTKAIEAVRTDVQLSEARIGARVASILGGRVADLEPAADGANRILDTLEYAASGAFDGWQRVARTADRLAHIRLVRGLASQAATAHGSSSLVAMVRDAADAVIIRAAAVAIGASDAPLYLLPARSASRAAVDIDVWRAEIESAFGRLRLSGPAVHVLSGDAQVPANAAGTSLVYSSVDSGTDVQGDLASHRSSLVNGGIVILASMEGEEISPATGAALAGLVGNTVEGAGTVIYARKRS